MGKKFILFTCLSLLTTCGIIQINRLLNLSLYSYHVERSTMENLGAWHFPKHLPNNVSRLNYHYDNTEQSMTLTFRTKTPTRYQNFLEKKQSDGSRCLSQTTVNFQSGDVTYYHKKWNTEQSSEPRKKAQLHTIAETALFHP